MSLNIRVLIKATIALIIFTIICFFAAFADDEGTTGGNMIIGALSGIFNVLRFPVHTLLGDLVQNPTMYFGGLLINCMFYGFLIERLIKLMRKK